MFETNNLIFKIGRPEAPDRILAALRILGLICILALQFQPAPEVLTEKRFLLADGSEVVVGAIEQKPYGYNVKTADGEQKYFKKEEVIAVEDMTGFRLPRWLLLGAFYFFFFFPAAFMSLAYNLAAGPVYLLNSLHAFITGRSHDDLNRFLIKQIAFDAKFQAMVAGLTDRFVHIDLYGREAEPFPLVFQARAETRVDRLIALLRLTLLVPLVVLLPYIVLCVAYSIAFVLLALAHWGIVLGTGRANEAVFTLMESILRYQGRLRIFALGLGNRPPPFWGSAVSENEIEFDFTGGEEQAPEDDEFYGTGSPRSLDLNLIVYTLLLVCSAGVYSYLWLARVTKVMGHDPFTVIGMCLLLPLLPLSIIFVRYYRRAEKLLKNEPSLILEFLSALPVVNLLVAPLLIQLVLNEYERARRMMKARS